MSLPAKRASSQIGAEAQGGKMTMWLALGIDQRLSPRWVSVTDMGYGRHSDPDNYLFSKRQGLAVVTEDFVFSPRSKWAFAFSGGYWRRNFYADDAPFDARSAPYQFRNELRPFQKIIYRQQLNRIRISHTLRTDYRFYFNQDLSDTWTTPFEFRLRLMESWKIPVSKNNKNWVVLIDEVLSAVDRYQYTSWSAWQQEWSPCAVTENRFSVYYRRAAFNEKIKLDVGVMHQYWRDKPGASGFNVSYNLMFDIIITDPFGKRSNTDEEKTE